MRSVLRDHRAVAWAARAWLAVATLTVAGSVWLAPVSPTQARDAVSAASPSGAATAAPTDVGSASSAPPVTWALSGNGTARGTNYAPDGDVLVTGNFLGTTGLGGITLTSRGAIDVFVFRVGPDGTVRWGRSFGGPNIDVGVDVDVDPRGDIYVTGQFEGTLDVGSGLTAASRGGSDAFLLKLAADGDPLWLRTAGGEADDGGDEVSPDRGAAPDGDGGVVMMGSFGSRPMRFPDGQTLSSEGGLDAFLARFDGTGRLVYAVSVGGEREDIGHGVQADAAGNAFMTGEFRGAVTLGGQTYAASGDPSSFAGAWGPDGRLLWFAVFGSEETTIVRAADVDAEGNVYVGGTFTGTLTFGAQSISADPGAKQLFLARLDSAGNPQWLVRFGGATRNEGVELQVAPTGEVFASGSVTGSAVFDGTSGSVTAGSPRQVGDFVVKYGPDGDVIWAAVDGAPGRPVNYAIARSDDGQTVTVGTTTGGAVFGGQPLGPNSGFYVAHRSAG